MFSVFELSPPLSLVPFELAIIAATSRLLQKENVLARGEYAFRHLASCHWLRFRKGLALTLSPCKSLFFHSLISTFHGLEL